MSFCSFNIVLLYTSQEKVIITFILILQTVTVTYPQRCFTTASATLYLSFSNGETVNVERAKLIFKGIDDKNITVPIEELKTETKTNSESASNFTLIQSGTSYTMALLNIASDTVFQLIAVNITKNETENVDGGETGNEPQYETYTVSNPSLICVNCNFCLNENSASIFLARVDFDKEKPEDKKKLFRQYISLPIQTKHPNFTVFNETSKKIKYME